MGIKLIAGLALLCFPEFSGIRIYCYQMSFKKIAPSNVWCQQYTTQIFDEIMKPIQIAKKKKSLNEA
jgi:hypothetical protein